MTAVLLIAVGVNAVPVWAAGETGTEYIVKYKQSAAWLMGDDRVPFDVVSEGTMNQMRFFGLLEWYEPDGVGELLDSSYYESYQWNLDVVQAEGSFQGNHLGRGVRVGVIDSGVNPHPDLGDRLLTGRNYMEDAEDPDDTADEYGHGTGVAGLIAGAGDHGYIGTAPEAELVPLKITDGKAIKVSAICRAIYGGIDDYDCDVLNLSLGVTGEFQSLKEAVDYAESQNVLLVSAVGNTGRTTAYYPAGYDSVIGVGAVDRDGNVSSRSNHNASVFLTAPGTDVRSLDASGSYSLHTGTSFAVPQVAGAAAVLLGIDPTLSPWEIMDLLAASAIDRGTEGCDEYYGYGILNLGGSVRMLTGEEEHLDPCSFLPETGPASQIRNNSGAVISGTYLLAAYDEDGVCLEVKSYPLQIPAYGTVEIKAPPTGSRYGQFVYETETMKPLTTERRSP